MKIVGNKAHKETSLIDELIILILRYFAWFHEPLFFYLQVLFKSKALTVNEKKHLTQLIKESEKDLEILWIKTLIVIEKELLGS